MTETGGEPGRSNVRRDVLILGAILLLGLIVRGCYLSEIVENPDFEHPGVDAGFHDYWARALATGEWTPPEGLPDPQIRTTPFFRPPGYPYFLGLIYRLTGGSHLAARLVQMVLGLINCLLAALIARRWFGRMAGMIAAVAMAGYWGFVYFEGELHAVVLLITLLLAAIYLLGLWAEKLRLWTLIAAGAALERLGRKSQAVKVYKTIEKPIAKQGFTKDAPSLVAAGRALDRIAILTGQKASEQAENILHNYFQKAYLDVDKSYWPANIAAAELLLAKYKHSQAAAELTLAAKANKRLPDVAVGRGLMHLGKYRFEKAIAQADRALKINPRHADGLVLKAATLMMWRKLDQAEAVLKKVLAFNPNHLETLATLAALEIRRYRPAKAQPYIERVEKVNPNYAQLHVAIGSWLSAVRQFDQAEKHFKRAAEMAPELAGPVTGLGRLYMQTGQEDLAREVLDKAFAIDDYREDVRNYLGLLDSMARFSVRETPHFIIKVDGKHDEVLLDWIADVAEEIHKEVSAHFKHTPPEKTLVELFPNHEQFSVRISGRGWIGTIGACTGRVIAMPAPDPLRGGFGQFNWYAVLRHEYTHAVTLSATRNRIPHWFTEACAVSEQPDRRNFQAVALLVNAVRNGKLYPIKELSWGFIRPQRSRGRGARSLAYAQSEWIFEFIKEEIGPDAIIAMLDGFRDGWTQQRIFKDILHTTEAKFDKDFVAWATKQV
ncbi:hypothetical protein LCGC14_1443880, partial [marine sediment metagenome]